MEIAKLIFALIWRRIISLIFLGFYIRSWIFCFTFFHTLPVITRPRCGMPDFGMIVFILILSLIYFITFLVLTLISKGRSRKEFGVILAIIPLPILTGVIDMFT